MAVRFSKNNWDKFFNSKKEQTIRSHELKTGWQAAIGGSRFKPIRFGTVYIHPFRKQCLIHQLTTEDAVLDGFPQEEGGLVALLMELARLNLELTPFSPVWVHPAQAKVAELDLRDR